MIIDGGHSIDSFDLSPAEKERLNKKVKAELKKQKDRLDAF